MKTEVPPELYREIEETIASDASPVGIDAKKTHILILHKLTLIEERLERLEQQLEQRLDESLEGAGDGRSG